MAPIINVQWEYAARLSGEVNSLKTEVNRQNTRITANQVTLAEIQQQLADGVNAIGGGGGMGWPLFKNAQYYRFVLAPNVPTKIVDATIEPTLRQLRFRLLAGTEVYLSGNESSIGSDWSPLVLNTGMLFQDNHDGGESWFALAPNGATILIEIRTSEQAQQAGEDFVIPFKAEPIINAVGSSSDYPNRLRGYVGSLAAFRCLDLQSFHPGQSYTFTIDVADAFMPWLVEEETHPDTATNRYGNKVIEVYAPNLYATLPELAIAYIAKLDYGMETPTVFNGGLIGVAKRGGWVASLGKDGGTFSFTPDFSHRHLFFFARVSQYAPGDFGTGIAEAVSFTYVPVTKTITIVGA